MPQSWCNKHQNFYKKYCFGCESNLPMDKEVAMIQQESVATKHDDNKTRLELLSPIALTEIAKVMTFGAKKYADHNWRKGFKWSRLLGATLRHVLAFMGGEDKDPESGISHLAHAGCCIMFLLEHESVHKQLDDRYKPEMKEGD